MIRDVHLIPGFWKIDGYTKMLRYIEETFDVTRDENLFEFPYDWRRDNRVAARRLARQSGSGWTRGARRAARRDAKLVLVGHSMGGLDLALLPRVPRRLARHADARDVRHPVPAARVNALDTLANGKKIKFFDLTELGRSLHVAIHQLLPTYPCYDGGDGELAYVDQADIPHLDRAKATAALDFHREIRAAVEAHLSRRRVRRGALRPRPRGRDQAADQQSAVRDGDRIKLLRTIGDEDPGGDGTVPRPSATPLEFEDDQGAAYSAERHALAAERRPRPAAAHGRAHGQRRSTGRASAAPFPMIDLALDVDDLYSTCRGRSSSGPAGPGAGRRRSSRSPSTSRRGRSAPAGR